MTTTISLPRVSDSFEEVPIIDTNTRLGIYVHVPFCQKHCPYCDFAVVTGMLHRAPEYVDALCAEIRAGAARHAPTPPVATVFLGGGTPSLLPAAQVARILDTIRSALPCNPMRKSRWKQIPAHSDPGTSRASARQA